MLKPVAPVGTLPSIRPIVYAIAAIGLALLGQQRLQASYFLDAALLYLVAIALIIAAFRRAQPSAPVDPPLVLSMSAHWGQGWWWRILPLLAAVGLGGLALQRFQANIELSALSAWQFYGGSSALCLLAAYLLDWGINKKRLAIGDWGFQPERPPNPQSPISNLFYLLFAILALAAFFRLWHFASLPFGVWYDEAENALQTLRFLGNTPGIPPAWPIIGGSIRPPAHYLALIALAFHFFGVSVQSVRAVSVAMGLATVLAAYLVGRELFGRAMGVALAFLLAVSHWAVNVSRFGMYNASTPLFALLAAGFLLRGLRRNRHLDFALAGLSLGLGLCFYAAFQLFLGVIGIFLLALLLFEWRTVRRTWSGLVLMGLMTLLVAAPMLLFAYEKPEIYFARTKETSLFAKKAPDERLPALLENVRKHVLMFNYRGDPNGRHNLPGEPMLDPYSGALMVLGLGISLWRWRQPRTLLLLAWWGGMLMGGILSLDFEAPQSLRAIGTLPVAYILALVPIHDVWRAWRRGDGRYYPNFWVAPLTLLLLVIGYQNFYTYFYRHAYDFATWNAYSAPETITANLLNGLDDQTEAYVIAYFHGHPTVNFLARGARPFQRIDTTDRLPMPWPADKQIALIVNADSRILFDEARRYYPNATFQEFGPDFGGPTVVYYALLSRADIASVQGLAGRYYANAQWEGEPVLAQQDANLRFDWQADSPLSAPFSVEWEGVLRVATYGAHQFFLQAPAYAELYIGETQVLSGTGELSTGLVLAQGNHAVRVRAVGGAGPFSLSWRPPDRDPELIPPAALYVAPVTSNGLQGNYYANDSWQGTPALARIDPQLNLYFHVTPLPRPYTVEWTGKIAIPQAGSYRFGLESIDESVLYIDNQEVTAGRLPNVYQDGTINLTPGLHDVRIRFHDRTDHTHVNFYWTPPGSGQQIVPAEVLFPPQGNYERVQMPNLATLLFDPAAPGAPEIVEASLPGLARSVYAGLNQPRGIAAGADGRIYVAETGNQRLLILSATGELLQTVTGGSAPFSEPFDVAIAAQGRVYVLDAAAGQVAIFTAEGDFEAYLPADTTLVERSRGIHVDANGHIWLAHTPAGRAVELDENGGLLQDIPVWPADGAQPVDVVTGTNGMLFVTDAGLHKLISYAADGRRLLAWDIAVANSIDGSHLAAGPDGFLYMTEPELSRIVKLTPQGERAGSWTVTGNNGALVKPIGITVDPAGRIWFADVAGGQIFVLEPGE